jgi:hypothetical protein
MVKPEIHPQQNAADTDKMIRLSPHFHEVSFIINASLQSIAQQPPESRRFCPNNAPAI